MSIEAAPLMRAPDIAKDAVVLQSVGKSFGNVSAVKDVSVAVQKGEFVAFIGPSGCGKTTTLRMIAGLERLTAGTIWINGRDVTHAKAWDRQLRWYGRTSRSSHS